MSTGWKSAWRFDAIERQNMIRQKTRNWDYFCELLMVIPGLAEVFNDYYPGDAEELRYKDIYRGLDMEGCELAKPVRVYSSSLLAKRRGLTDTKDAV